MVNINDIFMQNGIPVQSTKENPNLINPYSALGQTSNRLSAIKSNAPGGVYAKPVVKVGGKSFGISDAQKQESQMLGNGQAPTPSTPTNATPNSLGQNLLNFATSGRGGAFGEGVLAKSGNSLMPVSFSEALSSGMQSMNAYDSNTNKRELENLQLEEIKNKKIQNEQLIKQIDNLNISDDLKTFIKLNPSSATEIIKNMNKGNTYLEGTGLTTQLMNHVISYNKKIKNNEPVSQEETNLYNLAYQELSREEQITTSDGEKITKPGYNFEQSGLIVPEGTKAKKESLDRKKKTTTENNLIVNAESVMNDLNDLVFPKLFTNLDENNNLTENSDFLQMSAISGGLRMPGTEGRTAFQGLERAVEVLLRARSGAAVPPSELKAYMRQFGPNAFDSLEEAHTKIVRLRDINEGTLKNLKAGKPLEEMPLDEKYKTNNNKKLIYNQETGDFQ